MTRYWVGWSSATDLHPGYPPRPFLVYRKREMRRNPETGERDYVFRALFDAGGEMEVWDLVSRHYPDFRVRFSSAKRDGWLPPPSRFAAPECFVIGDVGIV